MEEKLTGGKEKKIQILLIIVMALICTSAIIWLTFASGIIGQGLTGTGFTTTYSGLSPTQGYELINSSEDTIIIDVRECQCNYNSGHIPNAIWNINPRSFFNETNDLLIYENKEALSLDFCESLKGHTYGAIYYLEGGMDAWKSANLPTEK